jgi:acid phosphatase
MLCWALIALAVDVHVLIAADNERAPVPPRALQWAKGLPVYDHVVIVVEENKDFDQIVGNQAAKYINTVLGAEGATLTRMFAEEHFSQGNYFWLFCGSDLNVGFHDLVPTTYFQDSNLAQQLIAHKKTFKGYAESLPEIGSTVKWFKRHRERIYGRKHVPWISFANVPGGPDPRTSCNLRWEDFPDPAHYADLPTVAFVIPNLINDMHNGTVVDEMIKRGDTWLAEHLDSYYQWAKTHNSLLIVTFDESDDQSNIAGLTDPTSAPTTQRRKDLQNRIVTIFAGAHIKCGQYTEGRGVTHVNILRTLEAMYGLPKSGAQQIYAARAGITDDYLITDIFK